MFPDAQHLPAVATQCAVHQLIPRPVRRQLLAPERCVVLGLGGVLGTTVPETAIHKDCELELGKNKIRFNLKGWAVLLL